MGSVWQHELGEEAASERVGGEGWTQSVHELDAMPDGTIYVCREAATHWASHPVGAGNSWRRVEPSSMSNSARRMYSQLRMDGAILDESAQKLLLLLLLC